MRDAPVSVETWGEVIVRGWRNRRATRILLLAGIVAAGLYVIGDLLSGLVYKGYRPYSFRDQWISELTAYGSPVRPLMVAVIVAHDGLLIAFGVGIWKAAGRSSRLRWTGWVVVAATILGLAIHPYFPMTSRWMESGFTDTMHGSLSMAWGVIIFIAVGLSAVAYRGWFRLYAIVTDVVLIGFGAASGIAIQGLEQNDTPWAGAFERINAYALMAWLVVLAVSVMRRTRASVRREETGSQGQTGITIPRWVAGGSHRSWRVSWSPETAAREASEIDQLLTEERPSRSRRPPTGARCIAGRNLKAGAPAGCQTAWRRMDPARIESGAREQP
ncbi:MAG: DUF998 domain-containing protein [Mycetocola sp.]